MTDEARREAMARHPASGSRRACNARACDAEGFEVLDHYGIPAGRWCEDHEDQAPGQFAYAGPDTEPLDEDQPNPGWRQEDA
jgi:hypothetical protein